ncbi:hypothetical protein EVAR_100652_1 [Eumeta japonica]|uniref:Uncharacterized protein n=1 Tax=Eumeta variegata TaxID=151549 RepID=A0A4C1SL45_EUMVA|nr:hypothetical protein EVAR_100652_1 [Eumeta japonica]
MSFWDNNLKQFRPALGPLGRLKGQALQYGKRDCRRIGGICQLAVPNFEQLLDEFFQPPAYGGLMEIVKFVIRADVNQSASSSSRSIHAGSASRARAGRRVIGAGDAARVNKTRRQNPSEIATVTHD